MESLFNKVAGLRFATLLKKTPTQVFSCEFLRTPFLTGLFFKLKNIFLLFSTFWKWSYSQRCFDVDQRCET